MLLCNLALLPLWLLVYGLETLLPSEHTPAFWPPFNTTMLPRERPQWLA